MALTFNQLRERYEITIGEPVPAAAFAQRVDDAVIEIAKLHGVRAGHDYPDNAGVEQDLPTDLLVIHEVTDDNHIPIVEYRVTAEDTIIIYLEGEHRLIYTRVPDPIDYDNPDSAEPDIHPIFHNNIIAYCVAKHWEEISEAIPEEEGKAQSLLAQFFKKVEDSALVLGRNPNQLHQIGYKLWRYNLRRQR